MPLLRVGLAMFLIVIGSGNLMFPIPATYVDLEDRKLIHATI